MHFWVVSQQSENWYGREEFLLSYFNEVACHMIDEKEFVLMMNQTQGLKNPIVLVPKGKYIWGQKMVNEWNDSSALAEFEHEYLSFHWETTA